MAANIQRALDRIKAKETAGKRPTPKPGEFYADEDDEGNFCVFNHATGDFAWENTTSMPAAHKLAAKRNGETAAPKATTDYTWYRYNADRATNLKTTNGKRTTRLAKGVKFGVRSGSKGSMRLITEEHGPTIVFTLTEKQADILVSKSRKAPAGKVKTDPPTNRLPQGKTKRAKNRINPGVAPKEDKTIKDFKSATKLMKVRLKDLKTAKFDLMYADHLAKVARALEKIGSSNQTHVNKAPVKQFLDLLELGYSNKGIKEKNLGNDNIKLGKMLLASAKKSLSEVSVTDFWIDSDGYLAFDHMAEMYLGDAADHIKLGIAIVEGRLKDAKKLSDLDTGSRDEIPEKAWNWIEDNLR